MPKKIKILHIINNLEVGGAEKMLVLLLQEMSKRKDVELYLISLEGHGPLSKDLPENVQYKEFKYKLFRPLLSRVDPQIRLGLLRYTRRIKPDIIHGHLFKGEDFAKVLGAMINTPVVTTSHDILTHPGRRGRFFNRYLARATAVSKIVADHLIRIYKLPVDKVEIIPNAIESGLFLNCDKKFNKTVPIFVYIGRLLKSKGIDDAIKGLAMLKKEYPGLKFLIYGKETFVGYKTYLNDLVTNNHWDFVKFMGRTDDVPGALKVSDIFISPSQSEGFAIGVLEAAAAGKPVIATKTGAITDMVIDGESGFFVEWGKPDQIYLAAKKILDDDLIESFGKKARQIATKSYDIKKVSDMYFDLYARIMNEKVISKGFSK